ncbi:MAG: hypothetical protein ACXWL8_04835, partial [Candidatus Limnocylindria bacterium]
MARPSKLTPERRKAIIDMIGYGVFAETAARAAGISPSTYYLWLQRGNAGEAPFSEFSDAVRAREAAVEVEAVSVLKAAAEDGDWRAAMRFLERRFPSRWGRGRRREYVVEATLESLIPASWSTFSSR